MVSQFVCKFTQKNLYCKLFRVFFNFINCFIHFFIYINGEQLKHIIERSGLKTKDFAERVNQELPAGVTTYYARHSWATIAASLDIPEDTISQALGHASRNSTTAIYIERVQRKVDEANRRVIDWVLYGKR